MGFSPRVRASSEVPRISTWPDDGDSAEVQGFAGYKAGMTHVVLINDEPNSPREGMEETVPVTVVETPPMRAVALRAYEQTPYGLRPLTEVWTDDVHEDLARAVDVGEHDSEGQEQLVRDALESGDLADVRLVTHTVPAATSVPKRKPDVMETRVGGSSLEERVDYAYAMEIAVPNVDGAIKIGMPGEVLLTPADSL